MQLHIHSYHIYEHISIVAQNQLVFFLTQNTLIYEQKNNYKIRGAVVESINVCLDSNHAIRLTAQPKPQTPSKKKGIAKILVVNLLVAVINFAITTKLPFDNLTVLKGPQNPTPDPQ